MQGAIFGLRELRFWQKLTEEYEEYEKTIPRDKSRKDIRLGLVLQFIKSYRPSPNGNGIKWSKEEKEQFVQLSLKEQRKMIVRKSELKSTLFPYVNVDYEPYKFSDRISNTAKKTYNKANSILESYSKIDFNNLDSKIQQDIIHNLRIAYNEKYLKAGLKLSQLLFKKSHLRGNKESKKDIQECNKIVKRLMSENIPENSYMYYQLYKWSIDDKRLFNNDITPQTLNIDRYEALKCYNHALESIVWEAIDEAAQNDDAERTLTAAELYLAAGIKYQSALAFYLAALHYAPSGMTNETLYYALIPYNACLRCAIALGNIDALDTLISNYKNGTRMMRKSALQVKLLEAYRTKRHLINGLDPYFDERFLPELIIDYSSLVFSSDYGGTIQYPGISRLITGVNYYNITIKDPRDKDSTPESIKTYYLKVWEMLVTSFKATIYATTAKKILMTNYMTYKIYQNLIYGLPSARPYIFPKEVLDLEMDFDKGLDGYGLMKYNYNFP